ncbi:hypothetical protein V9K67_22700 [Paraflavisolibacter sp. H34]|uniref:hypothetical protein n=1 Tax=Huijunlia imazamoxiresistens TaxID=3127457 RepID=UPI0030169263
MKSQLCLLFLFVLSTSLQAQYSFAGYDPKAPAYAYRPYSEDLLPPGYKRKLYQRNKGAIIGLQKGSSTFFEMGVEAHWRKLALTKPIITGATANLEYNFGNHILGYKAGLWRKRGRINLTYGANIAYFTDFDGNHKYGINPAVGFRFLGFHLINGVNLLVGDKELDKVNTLYLSLRYYFPIENKFTWDRKTMRKKEKARKERAKAKEKKRKEREERMEENPTLWDRVRKPFIKK